MLRPCHCGAVVIYDLLTVHYGTVVVWTSALLPAGAWAFKMQRSAEPCARKKTWKIKIKNCSDPSIPCEVNWLVATSSCTFGTVSYCKHFPHLTRAKKRSLAASEQTNSQTVLRRVNQWNLWSCGSVTVSQSETNWSFHLSHISPIMLFSPTYYICMMSFQCDWLNWVELLLW